MALAKFCAFVGVKEVRFGTDKDVKDEECSFLFNKYVPSHLMKRKVTLRMFVQ